MFLTNFVNRTFERLLSHEETGNMSSYKGHTSSKVVSKTVLAGPNIRKPRRKAPEIRDGWAQKWLKTMNKEQFHCPANLPKPPIKPE